jgi:hypothetical protein
MTHWMNAIQRLGMKHNMDTKQPFSQYINILTDMEKAFSCLVFFPFLFFLLFLECRIYFEKTLQHYLIPKIYFRQKIFTKESSWRKKTLLIVIFSSIWKFLKLRELRATAAATATSITSHPIVFNCFHFSPAFCSLSLVFPHLLSST